VIPVISFITNQPAVSPCALTLPTSLLGTGVSSRAAVLSDSTWRERGFAAAPTMGHVSALAIDHNSIASAAGAPSVVKTDAYGAKQAAPPRGVPR
jgi:hypothetical protein